MNREALYFWLAKTGYVGKIKHDILLKAYGSLYEAFYKIKAGEFKAVNGLGVKLYERLRFMSDEVTLLRDLKKMAISGIKFSSYFSENYPEKLKNIYSPPIGLFYKGRLPENKEKIIAIVGSRAASEKGLYKAAKTAEALAAHGVGIISGMAAGIDTAAHGGALNAGGTTYAVLGCGVDICYPKSSLYIYNEAAKKGGIISEYAPGTEPLRNNFPLRNRIISGLSDGVLVVEAMEKSGSLITADMGLEQGKNIYAIPGEAEALLSGGTNRLIQTGAKLVMDYKDILEDFDFEYGHTFRSLNKNLTLESKEKMVYATLCLEPKHISDITEETGYEVSELFIILFNLENKGYVKRTGFEHYVISK